MENIQNILTDQVQVPYALLKNYAKVQLTEEELLLVIHIHSSIQRGNCFPTPHHLSKFLAIDEHSCTTMLRSLIQRQLLSMNQVKNNDGRLEESYDLTPLWTKLYSYKETWKEPNQRTKSLDSTQIFKQFELEFARLLSPFEIEMISGWIDTDQFQLDLIEAALREAVLLGKLNLKYIDRILREWQKKGIRTTEQAKRESRVFRQAQSKANNNNEAKMKRDTSFYYNWLEGDD